MPSARSCQNLKSKADHGDQSDVLNTKSSFILNYNIMQWAYVIMISHTAKISAIFKENASKINVACIQSEMFACSTYMDIIRMLLA